MLCGPSILLTIRVLRVRATHFAACSDCVGIGNTKPLCTRTHPPPLPPEPGVAADELCLLLREEERPCPRPFPRQHAGRARALPCHAARRLAPGCRGRPVGAYGGRCKMPFEIPIRPKRATSSQAMTHAVAWYALLQLSSERRFTGMSLATVSQL